jgi:hypothetical protein
MSTAAVRAGEQAAKRTLCILAPTLLAVLVASKQRKQFAEHDREMERLGGLLCADLAAVDDRRERILVLAPQMAASAGARPAGCARLAEELAALDAAPLGGYEEEQQPAAPEVPVPAAKVAVW